MKLLLPALIASVTIVLAAALALTAAPAPAQLPNPATIVKPHSYVSLTAVPAGSPFDIAVVVEIQPGYHMNSHKPSESYLIPTEISLAAAPGFKEIKTTYPDGQMMQFSFSKEKLSVYSGKVTLRTRVQSEPTASQGDIALPFTLHFQACNDSACLPPTRVTVPVRLQVVAPGTKTQPAHPEIFQGS